MFIYIYIYINVKFIIFQANMFEQVCLQRDNMCISTEQSNLILDEEIWISKEIKFSDNENNNLDIW